MGVTASAPGRLDFLGGVADYSGSLVLETPIRAQTTVSIDEVAHPLVRVASRNHGRTELPVADALDSEIVRDHEPVWSRYVLGCLCLFSAAFDWQPARGLDIRIRSSVPEGAGIASSAALEVAVVRALGRLACIRWKGTQLARLAQRAENEIVGAPCGLMDQLTADHGIAGQLLPILCRPDKLRRPIPLPRGVRVVGWKSGVRHSVAGSPYGDARAATFMGRRIFESETDESYEHAAAIEPSTFERMAGRVVPKSIRGDAFRERYGDVADPLSKIEPRRRYRVRDALAFPIRENSRAEAALSLIANRRLAEVGKLLLESHAGYSSIGLGSPETDQMVDALRATDGVYGARASGGGSGGTVVVLLESRALPRLKALAAETSFRGVPTAVVS